jgi:hypothetical protein
MHQTPLYDAATPLAMGRKRKDDGSLLFSFESPPSLVDALHNIIPRHFSGA